MGALLLNGELAALGIIDAPAIDRALAGCDWMTDQVQLRISEMVALELWLRSWGSKPANPSTGS
jgi:hypothetical protein